MKSALELAMEKANEAVGGEDNIKLSDEQKAAIDQIRKLYEAKWAEKELQINERTAQLQKKKIPRAWQKHAPNYSVRPTP